MDSDSEQKFDMFEDDIEMIWPDIEGPDYPYEDWQYILPDEHEEVSSLAHNSHKTQNNSSTFHQ